VKSAARPFCSDISRENDEPLGATASRIDRWLLVEYRGLWSSKALPGSGLSDQVKARLRELQSAEPRTRLLLIRRPDRRHHPALLVYVADSRPGRERLARLEVGHHEELRDLDPWTAASEVDNPLFLACTHGKHDACCARYGRPLFEALSEQLEAEWAWQCTHVGGDRFAGNAVCLPHGLYYGRVERDDVPALVDEHLAGRISLSHYRGRSCWPFAVQAAERRIRAEEGLTALNDLALDQVVQQAADRWTVAFRTPLGRREVEVAAELGELTQLTCNAGAAKRPLRYVARPR
jgi:hypothetical protein